MGIHALLIDDDANNLSVMAEMLSDEGITVTLVSNPNTLFDAIDGLKRIDVVFLDLEMPNADGYQVLDVLKNEVGLTAPIVACTVHLTEINQARKLGFHSFIGKPLDLDRFPQQVRRILKGDVVWEGF